MATQQLAYDNANYTTREAFSGKLTGVSATIRFAAWADMYIKSVQMSVYTAGTSTTGGGDIVTAYKLLAAGTTTTTQALNTFGTGVQASVNAVSTMTLAQGDMLTIAHGTDATIDYAVAVEYQLIPGANITL